MKASIITFACILQIALLNAQPSVEWIIPQTYCKGEIKVDVNKNDWSQWYEVGHYPDTSAPLAWDYCVNAYDLQGDSIWFDLWDQGNTRDEARDIIFFEDSILISGFSGDSFGNWYNVFSTYNYDGQMLNRALTIDSFPFCGTVFFHGTSGNYYTHGQCICKYDFMYNVLSKEEGVVGAILGVDSVENLYMLGSLNKDSLNLTGYWHFTKYDSSFTLIWDYQYGPVVNVDIITDWTFDDKQNSYVTGWKFGPNDQDYITIKVNSSGVEQWVNIYDGPANWVDKPWAMAVDTDGNVYVTGESQQLICTAPPWWCFDVATIKYDSNGVEQWVKYYDSSVNDWDRGVAIALDDSGYIYVGGQSIGTDGDNDYLIIKYDAAGNELWVERYEEIDGPVLNYLALDENYNIYVSGVGPVIKYCQYGAKASFVADTLVAIIGDTLNFTNTSFNATWWSWDFGDGTTNTVNYNTSHTYDSAGAYSVELITWNGCGSDTVNVVIQVDSNFVGIREKIPEKAILQAQPNPFSNTTTILFSVPNEGKAILEVYGLTGRHLATLYDDFVDGRVIYTVEFNGSELPGGIYFYQLTTAEGIYYDKLILINGY